MPAGLAKPWMRGPAEAYARGAVSSPGPEEPPRPPKRFGYYARLSAAHKAIYRRSDEAPTPALPDAAAIRPIVVALAEALGEGKRVRVSKVAQAVADVVCGQLGAPEVKVRVREVRPQIDGGELHGLYTWANDGRTPLLEVWMRTGAREDVVKFRTFLRTFVHELVHHLDVTLLALPESFHTVGFFRRESGLVRQLLGEAARVPRAARPPAPAAPAPVRRQLSLFGD